MQVELRKWIYDNLQEEAEQFEESGKIPSKETFLKMGKYGLLAAKLGPGKILQMVCKGAQIRLPGGIDPEKFDVFHE